MSDNKDDLLYYRACEFVLRTQSASATHLQLQFQVGYRQASRWIERMQDNGLITPPKGRLH